MIESFFWMVLTVSTIFVTYSLLVINIDTRKGKKHYTTHLYAYKVGTLKNRARENGVELCFPTAEDKFLSEIEELVEEDISSAGE